MALDSELSELVKAIVNTNIAVEREELIDKIILKWTGCENIEKGSRGGNIDACRLGAVEKFYGRKFSGVNGANPNQTAAATLNAIYDEVCNNVMSMLMAQTCLEEMISQTKVVYSPVLGKKYINYGEVIEMFDGEMEKNPTDGIIKFGYYVNYTNFRYHTYI